MTPEEKRDRRQARHEAQRQIKACLSPEVRLRCTTGQLKAIVKTQTDRYFSFITSQPVLSSGLPSESENGAV